MIPKTFHLRLPLFCLSLFIGNFLWAASPIPLKTGTEDEIIASIESVVAKKKSSPEVVSSLVSALKSEDSQVRIRERAAWALGQLKASSAIIPLIEATKDKGLLVRSAALNALITMRSTKALPVYMDIAKTDPILSIRQRATLALGLTRSSQAIDSLVKLSSDEREEIRGAAVLAMTSLHSKKHDFSQVFQEMAADPSPYVQERAQKSLLMAQGKNKSVQAELSSNDPDLRLFAAVFFRAKGKSDDLKGLRSAAANEPDEDIQSEMKSAIRSIEKRIQDEKIRKAKLAAQKNVPTQRTKK